MKFFVAFALCVAVAAAGVITPIAVTDEAAEIQQIVEAINHPSTDPATAAALEQMLQDFLGHVPNPIDVGPAIVEEALPTPVAIAPSPVEIAPTPVIISPEVPAFENSPLVQIIINVKPGANNPVSVEGIESTPVVIAPSPQPEIVPTPVIVAPAPQPEVEPTPIIVAPAPQPEVEPTPVIVAPAPQPEVEPTPVIVAPALQPEVNPTPVIIVDESVVPEPVIVAPIIPSPVVLPDILN